MDREKMREMLQEIFREIFDDDTLEIAEQTCADDIEDWDSFAQIGLIMEIEKKFQIKFQMGEVSGLKNVGDMLSLLEKKL